MKAGELRVASLGEQGEAAIVELAGLIAAFYGALITKKVPEGLAHEITLKQAEQLFAQLSMIGAAETLKGVRGILGS